MELLLSWYKVITLQKNLLIISIFFSLLASTQACFAYQELKIRKNLDKRVQILSKEDKIRALRSGKGTWVNIWNYPQNVDQFISRLKKFHIDTVYLQVNRSTTPVMKHKDAIDEILKKAHAKNIKIIGWTYCYLKNIHADADKFIKVAQYVSPQGEKFDGMAADIEENTSLWAVRSYTNKIKAKLDKDYPLIAIVYSPKIKQDYPWEYVANNWDVLMPMTYWHGLKNRNNETVYNFVKESITDLRRLSKKDDLNIHLITDGDRTSQREVAISIQAAKDLGVNAGVSIYPEHLASDEMLKKLRYFD